MEMNRTQDENPVCSPSIKINTKSDDYYWKLLSPNMLSYWSSKMFSFYAATCNVSNSKVGHYVCALLHTYVCMHLPNYFSVRLYRDFFLVLIFKSTFT